MVPHLFHKPKRVCIYQSIVVRPLLLVRYGGIETHLMMPPLTGMKDGQRITFHGEGDQEPGLEPGDVIIVLDQKEHPVFTRQEDNLVMQMEIKLVEALCGFKKAILTLDSRTLIISTQPGTVFTVALVCVSIGTHLHVHRLHLFLSFSVSR